MALSIADQIALDDALVAPADRLKIVKCNLRLSSDVTSKEATLQVVYDVLKLTTHDDDIIHEEDTDEDDSSISSSDDKDSDNEVDGANVEGAKTDEDATYEVYEDEAQSKSSQLREEKAKKNIT
ncbi:hypothetical protein Tco_0350752 [Tanacetum coccineum]